MSDVIKRLKKWIEEDKKQGKHIYTEYTDTDGIPLAEGMLLMNAWQSGNRREYYVKRDVKKNKYYLQSYGENVYLLKEYYNKEYSKCNSIGIGIERASEDLQILYRDMPGDFRIMFLEDIGFDKYPPRIVCDDKGYIKFIEVKE